MNEQLKWFAVRTILRHEVVGDKGMYEERINLYLTNTADDAIKRASHDVTKYLELNKGFVPFKKLDVYELDHNRPNLDGEEVWSNMSGGPVNIEEFYSEKYSKFEHRE